MNSDEKVSSGRSANDATRSDPSEVGGVRSHAKAIEPPAAPLPGETTGSRSETRSESGEPQRQSGAPPPTVTTPAILPVVEERVVIDRRSVETGRVLIRRHVEEERVIVERPVYESAVEVERREVNEFIDEPPSVRTEDDGQGNEIIIVPVIEEVLVVQKRLMLKEEVRLRRRVSERLERQVETVRRHDVEVTRDAAPTSAPTTARTASPDRDPDAEERRGDLHGG